MSLELILMIRVWMDTFHRSFSLCVKNASMAALKYICKRLVLLEQFVFAFVRKHCYTLKKLTLKAKESFRCLLPWCHLRKFFCQSAKNDFETRVAFVATAVATNFLSNLFLPHLHALINLPKKNWPCMVMVWSCSNYLRKYHRSYA